MRKGMATTATMRAAVGAFPSALGSICLPRELTLGPHHESDAELPKKSEMEKTCPPSPPVTGFYACPSCLKLQARSTVAFKLLKHRLTSSDKQSAEVKVKNSSNSAGSNHKILYVKKQAGDFHDLQLHFLQLRLIPLLLDPASLPDLLLYLPKYPSLAHTAFLRDTPLNSHCASPPPSSHHPYSIAEPSNSCNPFGAKCCHISLLCCHHLLCVDALQLHLLIFMPFTLLTHAHSHCLLSPPASVPS